MNQQASGSAIGSLRALAHRLDIQVGVERRKRILEGNERLTWATDARTWNEWLSQVEGRLRLAVGDQLAQELIHYAGEAPGGNAGAE
jgi:hypothetical protein